MNDAIKQMDELEGVNLKGVKTQLSDNRVTAFTDIVQQDITLIDGYKKKVDEYLCSVLSTV